jgi:signal recognition particle receptor subunit beta
MALINHTKKEINAKIVYYGPAGSGKSTALSYIFSRIKPALRGELRSVPAGSNTMLLFDFSPFDTPLPHGYHVRLHLYTLTGKVTNPATWKMTLKGTDGVMIMVNPAAEQAAANRESVSQLRDFLAAYGVGLHDTPAVLQLNRFTQSDRSDRAEIAASLDLTTLTVCHSAVKSGEGVLEALTALSRQVLERVSAQVTETIQTTPVTNPEPEIHSQAPFTVLMPVAENPLPEPIGEKTVETPQVTLLQEGLELDGTTIKIPLEIRCGKCSSRFTVSVSVSPEA